LAVEADNKVFMFELLESRIAPATFVVTTLSDSGEGSLRDVIATANANPGADVITFQSGLTGVIDMTGGQMNITDALAIKGPGATSLTINAHLQSRIFLVDDNNDAKDSSLTLSGVTLLQGKHAPVLGESDRGGAIASIESLNVNDCLFARNLADGSGGAIVVLQVPDGVPISLDVRNSTFQTNSSELLAAGAIGANVGGSITLKNTRFIDNSAGTTGGAVSLQAGKNQTLLVQNCQFLDNQASEAGAGFFGGNDTNATIIRNSLFSGNEASARNGGGAVVGGGRVLIERSAFIENIGQSHGGGLDVTALSLLVIRSSQFVDNALLGEGSGGGGLEVSVPEGSSARIIGSIISGNSAGQGGGIQISEGSGSVGIIGSHINGNHAATSGGGIVVLEEIGTHRSADLSVFRSTLLGNVAEFGIGGGLAVFGDGEFNMLFSKVIENTATAAGGGISLSGTTLASIIGSIIAQNSAKGEGGGIFALSPLEVFASGVLCNAATDGGGIWSSSDLTLNFSLVSGNSATTGGGIFHKLGSELLLNRTRVIGNFSPDGRQIVEG
jgi:hypothetical protein